MLGFIPVQDRFQPCPDLSVARSEELQRLSESMKAFGQIVEQARANKPLKEI